MTLGVDYGRKKVGTALCDPGKTLPTPYRLLRYKTDDSLRKQLIEIVRREEITTLVFGDPLAADGNANPWSRHVRWFGETLSEATGLPVVFVDERHSSQEADIALRGSSVRAKGEYHDMLAAKIILERYIASL